MAIRTYLATLSLVALAAPAFASGVIHNANTEMGYTTHPEHATTGLTRAQVLEQLQSAQKDPAWNQMRVGVTPSKFTPSLTRAEVEAELQRAQKHPTWAARRVGAPVTMN